MDAAEAPRVLWYKHRRRQLTCSWLSPTHSQRWDVAAAVWAKTQYSSTGTSQKYLCMCSCNDQSRSAGWDLQCSEVGACSDRAAPVPARWSWVPRWGASAWQWAPACAGCSEGCGNTQKDHAEHSSQTMAFLPDFLNHIFLRGVQYLCSSVAPRGSVNASLCPWAWPTLNVQHK